MTEHLTNDEKKEVDDVLNEIGAYRTPYHGNAFEGREVRAILNNLEKFPSCISRNSYFNALKYFGSFLEKCGGIRRESDWKQSVIDFLIAFEQTGLPTFLKVHMVTHVSQYFSILDSICPFLNPGLAWMGEQALEASHQHFKKTWERFKKTPKSKNSLLLVVKD